MALLNDDSDEIEAAISGEGDDDLDDVEDAFDQRHPQNTTLRAAGGGAPGSPRRVRAGQ